MNGIICLETNFILGFLNIIFSKSFLDNPYLSKWENGFLAILIFESWKVWCMILRKKPFFFLFKVVEIKDSNTKKKENFLPVYLFGGWVIKAFYG